MYDNKLASEEARREAQHDTVKAKVDREVNQEMLAHADHGSETEAQRMQQVAGDFRGKAISEVVETERELTNARRMARVSQIVDFSFYLIYSLLAIRLLLALLAARPHAGFMQFINIITGPFYAPFRGIVASPTAEGGYTLALPIVIAIVVYALLHAGISALLRLIAQRKTEI